jgi:hypothetical protein
VLCLFWALPQSPVIPIDNRLAWSAILGLQALPYLAAVACSMLSAIGQATPHDQERVQTTTARTVHWASPEGSRSGMTAEAVTRNPQPPG